MHFIGQCLLIATPVCHGICRAMSFNYHTSLSWHMSRRGICYAYSIIYAHLCSHSPEFEILIGLTQMDFNPSRLCLCAWVIGDVIHAVFSCPALANEVLVDVASLTTARSSDGSIVTMTGKVLTGRFILVLCQIYCLFIFEQLQFQ